jgi:lipopolysaccharide/colanic/teichoic acid biosynthesis glycosyltransferase
LTRAQAFTKRTLDVVLAAAGLFVAAIPLAILAAAVKRSSPGPALFRQERVGRGGRTFNCVKLRTMRLGAEAMGTVTTKGDERVTPVGRWMRQYKLDEMPQLWNVLVGDMSLVGPRPDVPGFADQLAGADRVVLSVRPGITGPATLRFRDEEEELALQEDPVRYNREVVFPEKVRLNKQYVESYSCLADLGYMWRTLVPKRRDR